MQKFTSYFYTKEYIPVLEMEHRKLRPCIAGFKNTYIFMAGDIIKIAYMKRNLPFTFEGLCLGIKGKHFIKPDTKFTLRNILLGIGIEIQVSFFYFRVYEFLFQDYKRKMKGFYKSKLYFVRNRVNRQSRVA